MQNKNIVIVQTRIPNGSTVEHMYLKTVVHDLVKLVLPTLELLLLPIVKIGEGSDHHLYFRMPLHDQTKDQFQTTLSHLLGGTVFSIESEGTVDDAPDIEAALVQLVSQHETNNGMMRGVLDWLPPTPGPDAARRWSDSGHEDEEEVE